jgi:regulator of protease activity HflC (stomatin/prohibitin superfamily)
VQDYQFAISQLAQTSLRSVIGKAELDDLLSNREKLGAELTEIIDARPSSRGGSRSSGWRSRT